MSTLRDDVDEGSLNVEEVLAGREIVLYLPDYAVENSQNSICYYIDDELSEKSDTLPTMPL